MPDKPKLDAVLLDAGGTLVRLDFEWMSGTLRELGLDVPVERLRRGEIDGRRRYDRSRGHAPGPGEPTPALGTTGDTNAYYTGILIGAGVPAAHIPQVVERFRRRHAESGLWARPMEGARDAVDRLERMGLRRAVVSNSDGRAEQHLRDCDLLRGIEFVIDSEIVGIEKPDPGIFAIALERLGIAPERALFVGDIRCVDEAGARAAGVQFVILDPFGNYAPADCDSIPDMYQLARWVGEKFEVPVPYKRGHSYGGSRTASAPPAPTPSPEESGS